LGTGAVSGNGVASFIASFGTAGSHDLTAVYGGDFKNAAITSPVLAQTVGNASGTLPSPPISPVPVTNYEYDAEGNQTKVVLAAGVAGFGLATSTGYDSLRAALRRSPTPRTGSSSRASTDRTASPR
jgi:hypothetical protein